MELNVQFSLTTCHVETCFMVENQLAIATESHPLKSAKTPNKMNKEITVLANGMVL